MTCECWVLELSFVVHDSSLLASNSSARRSGKFCSIDYTLQKTINNMHLCNFADNISSDLRLEVVSLVVPLFHWKSRASKPSQVKHQVFCWLLVFSQRQLHWASPSVKWQMLFKPSRVFLTLFLHTVIMTSKYYIPSELNVLFLYWCRCFTFQS